jgi:hypothetical protein
MTATEVTDELRRTTGTPWKDESDGPRRAPLWRRLDELEAQGRLPPNSAPTAVPPPAEGHHAQCAKPPDLQALVARFGTYSEITKEAWAEFDRAMETYHIERRARLAAERMAGWTSKK